MTVSDYRAICQKGALENYLFDKYVFRRISIWGTIAAIKLRISPNLVTFLSLVCALGSLYPLSSNDPKLVVVGCALVFLYNFLDHVDGELARYYFHTESRTSGLSGQFFDVLCHSYSANLMMLFTAWAVYNEHQMPWILLVGVGAMVGLSGFPNLVAAKVMMIKIVGDPSVIGSEGAAPLLYELEKKQRQVSEVNAPLFSIRKIRKICTEALGFPGILMIVIAVNLFDAFNEPLRTGQWVLDARIAALLLVVCVHLPYAVVRTRKLMKLLSSVQ